MNSQRFVAIVLASLAMGAIACGALTQPSARTPPATATSPDPTRTPKPSDPFDALIGAWEGEVEGSISFVGDYGPLTVRAEIFRDANGELAATMTYDGDPPLSVTPSSYPIDSEGYFCFADYVDHLIEGEEVEFRGFCFRPRNVDSVDYYMAGPSFGDDGILYRVGP